ncbi:oxygenase MpaB family protein [Pedobacter sp. B4-66]|uniref:oxygenase MpaB family protein n=1 Tax=Pedobacter sp. B4-66 TaxID=2817280 RepID=UPI001BD98C4A|nr:oxygenase MpaB family protein [Pedobacter sp. B4-66]
MDLYLKRFWEEGSGNQLVEWSGAQISLDNPNVFTLLAKEYDVPGDEAVQEIFKGRNFGEAYAYVTQLSKTIISENDDLPENIKSMFLAMQQKPAWVDDDLIQMGCNLCMRSGTNALISLRDYSLMSGYDYAYLNKALIYTGALKKGPAKRITDTLDFWIHVTRNNALGINALGYQYIARTRMMHSFSRLMIKEKYADWDHEKWGEPINFGDMVATNIGFSLFYLHGLHKLGMHISEKEELGVFHLWKYVGHLLGIPEKHLPNNKKEATELFYLWTDGQVSADEDSVMLAQALENEAFASNIFKKAYQKNFLKYLHSCYVRFLIDEETCNRLHISKIRMYYLFPRFRKFRNQILQKIIGMSSKNYQRAVTMGDIFQTKISQEYLKADS